MVLKMDLAIGIQIEKLPEGIYLATSDELPGLVAQGRTIAEALDIARDVARKLIEARRGREGGNLVAHCLKSSRLHDRGGRIVGPARRLSMSRYRSEADSSHLASKLN